MHYKQDKMSQLLKLWACGTAIKQLKEDWLTSYSDSFLFLKRFITLAGNFEGSLCLNVQLLLHAS